jgi:hypothetical protein
MKYFITPRLFIRTVLAVLAFALFAPFSASAATINVANCSFTAVQSAVTGAAVGTTIQIPAGDCNWGSSQLNVPGGITLRGAGKTSTIIRRTTTVSQNAYVIKFDCSNGQRVELSDMTLMGYGDIYPNPPVSNGDKGVGLMNGCVDFKIYNAKFTRFIFAAIELIGPLKQRGVIFNNDFINNYNDAVRNLGYGIAVYGDGTWPALELGTQNSVFVEDNYMIGNRHHIASNNSARYVFRHNTVIATNVTKDFAMTDIHGLSSWPRGGRSYEIYNNNYSAQLSSGAVYAAVGIRGGDGVIFNNTVSSSIANPVILGVEGFTCGTYPGPDQVRAAWIWGNNAGAIRNDCTSSIQLNRDYFTYAKSGYVPYTYPHPLR